MQPPGTACGVCAPTCHVQEAGGVEVVVLPQGVQLLLLEGAQAAKAQVQALVQRLQAAGQRGGQGYQLHPGLKGHGDIVSLDPFVTLTAAAAPPDADMCIEGLASPLPPPLPG